VYVAQDESSKVTAQGKVAMLAEGFCELVETLESPKGTKMGLETGTQAMWVARPRPKDDLGRKTSNRWLEGTGREAFDNTNQVKVKRSHTEMIV
jgi:hypothetical protein